MEFAASRFTDYWIEDGPVLAPKFFLFAHLGDGTDIGYWLHDGNTIDNAPIVLIGSEGGLDLLATSSLSDYGNRGQKLAAQSQILPIFYVNIEHIDSKMGEIWVVQADFELI